MDLLISCLTQNDHRIDFCPIAFRILPKCLTAALHEKSTGLVGTCSCCSSPNLSCRLFPIFTHQTDSAFLVLSRCSSLCKQCFALHDPSRVLSSFAASNFDEGSIDPLILHWVQVSCKSLDSVSELLSSATAAYSLQQLSSFQNIKILDSSGSPINSNWNSDTIFAKVEKKESKTDLRPKKKKEEIAGLIVSGKCRQQKFDFFSLIYGCLVPNFSI
ncbi:hypothetical protein GEMRC1_013714 [Eukaryota sp. GEM-RC1]